MLKAGLVSPRPYRFCAADARTGGAQRLALSPPERTTAGGGKCGKSRYARAPEKGNEPIGPMPISPEMLSPVTLPL
ncbi:hypothetical protein SAMN05444123_107275 [Rhodopseudomonas pseudopalustris]|uniref:Uncharacterized protein n=1 Tax=Rhodopseudomonas pseudopalustris TaxID=1513892 RepID=A0A1H8UVY0_9BRAD|nr:hypothetical protein SAMN05444123_107275 [Rhodopseudomonas pseudopalustris]